MKEFDLEQLAAYIMQLQNRKMDILGREYSIDGEMGPIFDSEGNYNPARAQEEAKVQLELDKKALMAKEQELLQVVSPLLNNSLTAEVQRMQQEQQANMMVEQMANQPEVQSLPGDIIR